MVTLTPAAAPEKLAGWTLHRPPEPAAHVGRLFAGRYLLLRKIGSGGMGSVYAARDATLGHFVVVKVLRPDLPSDPVDRFRREALVLAKLSHEHIGGILDRQDPDDGPRFLVTEYIDGLDLSELRRRGPVPAAVVLQLGLQVSAALAYAHAHGVIHRDIKPSNLMLVRHPGGDVFAKVIDFGIAKLALGSDVAAEAPAAARRETRGDVPGTVPYWSGHEGPHRDVFALALTLIELLTGEDPNPAADLTGEHIPRPLAEALTAVMRAAITTMDGLHVALREADVQPPADAESERRRYIASVFQREPSEAGEPTKDRGGDVERFADRYIPCGELGAGGMGRVRVVFDTVARRRVALKTIQPRCADMKNLEHRLRREAWALAAIDHPGAPRMYDSNTEPEPYFTMEIVRGTPLSEVLADGKLSPERTLGVAIVLAEILHAAHEVGVVHRDVKPSNILLCPGDRVRLIDFGACLLMPRFHQRHLLFPATPPEQRYATGEREQVGSPGYTAPEVLAIAGGVGPRSDVYSLCVVLYEMLTGRRYEDPGRGRADPIDPREFPSKLGPIADLLRRGTAREPSERPWTMADLGRSLEILRAALIHAQERRRLALSATLTVVATLVAFGGALHLVTSRASSSPPVVAPPTTPSSSTPSEHRAAPPRQPEPKPLPPAPRASENSTVAAQDSPPGSVQLATTVLDAATVRARLASRRSGLKKCGAQLLALEVKISMGRLVLNAVNGMSGDDPLHACVAQQLRGLAFPRTSTPRDYVVTLDLQEK